MARGSIVKRSGSWYAVYRLDGHQKWEKSGLDKRAAEKLLSKRLHEIDSSSYVEPKKIRFDDFVRIWLADYARTSLKPSTYVSYEMVIRLHLAPVFGQRMLHQIRAGEVQRLISGLITEKGLSPKTAINVVVPLKEMFKHAVIWGYAASDPTIGVKRPRVHHQEMHFLNPEEIRLFLAAVAPQHYPLFLTAVMTGMRRGELFALQWGDIDRKQAEIQVSRSFVRNQISSPKSRYSIRRIVMSPLLYNVMKRLYQSEPRTAGDLIFANEVGTYIDADNFVKREFSPALKRAGLNRIRFHDLRHTYATLLIAQGENVKFVQSQLGHSSAKTTLDRYGHLMPNAKTEAAKLLDQTVFGPAVRKLLENEANVDIPVNKAPSEVITLQRVNLVAGAGFEPATFGL